MTPDDALGPCIDEPTLAAFVDGDLGEHLAVHVALHLDACPGCAARAVGADPLARAFASVDDPPLPDDLVAAALAEVDRPAPAPPWVEVLVGTACLVAAASLVAWQGLPASWLDAVRPVLTASGALVRHALPPSGIAEGLAVVLLGIAGVTMARLATDGRSLGGPPLRGAR